MAKLNVIKYEGDNSTFVWKHPREDFRTMSQLIVHESQEAIFFMNGQALDRFGPGRYTLETQNLPLLGKIISATTGGKTPFHCEVYFINKTEQASIRWGTDSKVTYMDPTYNVPFSIGASGEMVLSVADARKLLVKLVGTETRLDREGLISFFRGVLNKKIKSYIAQTMRANAISVFAIDENLDVFSKEIEAKLAADFFEYGVALKHFYVTTVLKPDGDAQYEAFKNLFYRQYLEIAEAKLKQQTDIIYAQTEAQKVLIDSEALAGKRTQEGYTYADERSFDVAQDVAKNQATAQIANFGIGLKLASGINNNFASLVGDAVKNAIGDLVEEVVEEEEIAEEAVEEEVALEEAVAEEAVAEEAAIEEAVVEEIAETAAEEV